MFTFVSYLVLLFSALAFTLVLYLGLVRIGYLYIVHIKTFLI